MIDWEQIVREHGPTVWRTAHRLLGNRADADECFQETFAAALALTRASAGPVRHWRGLLVSLAVARGVDQLRRRVRRTSRESAGAEVEWLADHRQESRPARAAERSELSDRLRLALSHLPPKQADAFCLHCLEGWSYREAAEQMEITTDHVGVLVHRARAALRLQIDSILSNRATANDPFPRGDGRPGRVAAPAADPIPHEDQHERGEP